MSEKFVDITHTVEQDANRLSTSSAHGECSACAITLRS